MARFNIDKDEMYQFGITETILPPIDLVAQNWEEVKKRIFNNTNVKKDATNSVEPQKIISRLTGYKRNTNLFNYQVSHIFGKTKNIFLFEAPWNIALVP
ncbi:hypothetical protein Desor_3879 [Desulfosporosinus orientis DSM 765]|uniref:Uncharacterized protein n=1 Tax=Desulfosporosinus orientis (strain ATCC 19365 / DSM 765 / NCIMB 8382 / VKM B-1628 / Singapore I) TaxID=768706 RepID=G7WBT1_DESOD|nr:hypothetical protein [Desulfosporosinus orientis]AET69328.1 hypothetical protein Desor_3879 [Desulfosporosinus orientis DSM 765]